MANQKSKIAGTIIFVKDKHSYPANLKIGSLTPDSTQMLPMMGDPLIGISRPGKNRIADKNRFNVIIDSARGPAASVPVEKQEHRMEVKSNVLEKNLSQLIDQFTAILNRLGNTPKEGFSADEIEVGFRVSENSEVMVATDGASASIKVTFRRK